MEDCYEQDQQLRALAMRVAALEENVAFLEEWCEEQQDTLDRTAGPIGFDYEVEPPVLLPAPRLRVVDLRDGTVRDQADDVDDAEVDAIVAVVDTDHERRVRQIRAQINRLRTRLALSVAPPAEDRTPSPPAPRRAPAPGAGRVSAKQAGRTAP